MSTPVQLPSSRRHLRWAVPAVAVAVVVAGFAARPLLASADSTGLPPVTADQLVAKVVAAAPQPLSGTVVYTANLGLPDVSALAGAMGASATVADPVNLLSGSSTLRVWTDAAQRSRVSLLGTTSEYSVVHDATQAWSYSSNDRSVVHYTLSAADKARLQAGGKGTAMPSIPADLPTPSAAATDLLTQVKQFSTVSLDAATKVAGRNAYQLVVTPTSRSTLVARVVVAVDGATDTPLRLQVWSRQDTAKPALEIGFTDVSFAKPSATALSFSPPAGAKVKEVQVPLPSAADLAAGQQAATTQAGKATVSGSGWDSVVTLTGVPVSALTAGQLSSLAGSVPAAKAQKIAGQLGTSMPGAGTDPGTLINALTTKVPGGRLLSSSLLSVLVLDDGRVLAGSVPPATLTTLAG